MISDRTIREIHDFVIARGWNQYHTPENLAKSISIEAAELLECYQWIPQSSSVDEKHVREELADVLTYCIMMADALDIDLDKIIMDKLAITKRKYPAEAVRNNFDEYETRHLNARREKGNAF
ncbi:nucleotide pyrophosphohydrolase [Bifidobacterium simiarum]|uniref:Nucleotide pyrophosphohydrolase n=1 Tax=Bifidobacterium simiarum TaxID=2045441 RepID=A0A2M9HCJ6_9BIFI|nr:nucleotide pyrophosphohydrolase [Bifidobacterium simiarum]PJM74534.1 nucleotide pyrophosphohydrolase [Bifidobacterium simiarum]